MSPILPVMPAVTYGRPMSPLLTWVLIGGKRVQRPAGPSFRDSEFSAFRKYFGPIFLIVVPWLFSLTIPIVVYNFDSSIVKAATFVMANGVEPIIAMIPPPSVAGVVILFGWGLIQLLFLHLLPGNIIRGPPTPMGEQPPYKDNGMKAWFATHGLYVLLGPFGLDVVPFGDLYQYWGTVIATANWLAVPFCCLLYVKGRFFPSTRDCVYHGVSGLIFDFFQGTELHPRLFGVSVKQIVISRGSMMAWSFASICFAQAQWEHSGRTEWCMPTAVSCVLHVAYLAKFFWWEAGYFHSIDIIHDRCGWYLMWGVMVWVPSVYNLIGFVLVKQAPMGAWPTWAWAALLLFGLLSLHVNYEADLQRQRARKCDGKLNIWGKPAEIIRAEYKTGESDEVRKSLLLVSGYWGLARHFHYLPELSLAWSWCLPCLFFRDDYAVVGMFYWAYLTILLVDRAYRDDVKCRAKYTKYWAEYCRRVPYKIVPGIY